MTAFMVSSQVNDSVIAKPEIEGFRMGLDFRLEHRQKPHLSAALFQQYVRNALIPFIDDIWTNGEFAGKPAILLIDNRSIT